jgi:RNA polymerase sigma-70 factor (ECF subfamily)
VALLPAPWTVLAPGREGHAGAADSDAMRSIYERFAPAIRRFLCALVRDRSAADDAVQETFARAIARLASLREGDRIAPWLFGIARNVSLEQRRARVRDGDAAGRDGADIGHARTPEAALLGEETARVVARALGELGEERRAALLLRIDHGLSYDDIAQTMGWSVAKAKIEVHRARLVLRAHLDEYEGEKGCAR